MLSLQHVARALQEKRETFSRFEQRMGSDVQLAREALDLLAGSDSASIRQALLQSGVERPGACPTQERVAGHPIVRSFGPNWQNRQQANQWALEQLNERITVAVDGSQITPNRDFSIPVGAVQVGWFRNPHDTTGTYVKDIHFEVLGPNELSGNEGNNATFPDTAVNLCRFELECQVLTEQMAMLTKSTRLPVCFFDGSLILSFAAQMAPTLQKRYVKSILGLLDTAEALRVPVVGYIDTSYAQDLMHMLGCLHHWDDSFSIADASAIGPSMQWGDRTELFECHRDDQLAREPLGGYYSRVHFCYLKTTSNNAPARLEIPEWVLAEGWVEEIMDVVRAECIVGTGYPYAVETADATAVLTMQDRERFYRAFQQFMQQLGVPLHYARKAESKRRRR